MTTELVVTFDEMSVLTEDGIELFVLDMGDLADVPPFYIDVAGRRFSYASATFPVKGHGATLPPFVRAEEAAGHLLLLGERGGRYLAYVHDPDTVVDDEDEE
jgi:hypothetical protein